MPAEQPEAMGEYREFLDWYTKLNTLLRGGPAAGTAVAGERGAGQA